MKARVLKTIGVVMAAVMCLGMTALAAPSQEAPTYVVKGVSAATDKAGNKVPVTMDSNFSAEEQKAVDTLKTEDGLKAVLGDAYNANMIIANIVNVTADVAEDAYPLIITFNVTGVTASSKGQILNFNGTSWVKVPTTFGEGTMTGEFDHLSPVAFVVDKTTVSGSKTSPKTSASSTAAVTLIGLCAVVAAVGLKKKSFVK